MSLFFNTLHTALCTLQTVLSKLDTDFRITPMKYGFNTVRLHWSKNGIRSVLTLGASLALIIFTVLIRKSEKHWKVLRDCLKNLQTGIPVVIRLSLGAAPLGKVWWLSGMPEGIFFQTTPTTFPYLYHTSLCTLHAAICELHTACEHFPFIYYCTIRTSHSILQT